MGLIYPVCDSWLFLFNEYKTLDRATVLYVSVGGEILKDKISSKCKNLNSWDNFLIWGKVL